MTASGRMGISGTAGPGLTIALAFAAMLGPPAYAVERKLLVSTFEDIVIVGDINVVLETGRSVSATASGDKKTLEALKLDRVGTTLRIRMQNVVNNDKGTPVIGPVTLTLSTPNIRNIVLSGNGQLRVNAIKQPNASKIVIAGGGKVTAGAVTSDQFTAEINGNGQIDIGGGIVRDGRVTIIGAGTYQAANLKVRKLRLEHNGNATSSANVEEGTDIYNRGSGNISIGGKGTCFIKLAGNAAIKCATIDNGGGK